tara:strand:- start:2622 stop:2876 length:255 start_codon:yes stop_codon:yes gene_type:complete
MANTKNIKVKLKNGSEMNVQEFIKKQYKSKISNFFTTKNLNIIRYALEVQLIDDPNGEVQKAIDKIDSLAKYKGLIDNNTIAYK